jgi:hypothetical protein
MRLSSLTGMVAYHITTASAIPSIQKNGLTSGNAARLGHPGAGIYVIFSDSPLSAANDFSEYLDIDEPVLLQVRVSENDLLMDEDALTNEESIEKITSGRVKLPKEFIDAYTKIIEEDEGDDEDSLRSPLIALIDQYQIKPTKKLMTEYGHYAYLTARCVTQSLPITNIWKLDSDTSEWQEAKLA